MNVVLPCLDILTHTLAHLWIQSLVRNNLQQAKFICLSIIIIIITASLILFWAKSAICGRRYVAIVNSINFGVWAI